MAIDSRGILADLTSFAASSGRFDSVTGHEPKSAPARTGVSCSLWVMSMRTALSGLNSMSVVLTIQMRIYTSMTQEPQDEIDPLVLDATDVLFTSLAGSFTLSGKARYVDIHGSDSDGLQANAGYLNQDGKLMRVMDITVPVIINDAYAESA